MRKQDYASGSGPTFSGKTKGSRGISNIRAGVGSRPQSGKEKAHRGVGWPGAQSSSLGPEDKHQSAK